MEGRTPQMHHSSMKRYCWSRSSIDLTWVITTCLEFKIAVVIHEKKSAFHNSLTALSFIQPFLIKCSLSLKEGNIDLLFLDGHSTVRWLIWLSTWLHQEVICKQLGTHVGDFLEWLIWGGKTLPKLGPCLLVAAHIEEHERKNVLIFVCLPLLSPGKFTYHVAERFVC